MNVLFVLNPADGTFNIDEDEANVFVSSEQTEENNNIHLELFLL